MIGLVPVIGEIADGANAIIYAAKGDYANAALSAAAMLPVGGQAATGAKLGIRGVNAAIDAGRTASRGADDVIRMRHYTSESSAASILSQGIINAGDQGKVFMTRAKGKPLSPSDAERTLGIGRGRGRAVIEFDVPRSAVSERFNPTMNIYEWVADGNLAITNATRVR